jgi:hypothetical protein
MIGSRTCAYFGWTQVIGVAWYGVFACLGDGLVTRPEYLLARYSVLVPFAMFLVVSSIMGFAFRRWIRRATRWQAVVLGSVLPFLGGPLYALIWPGSMRILQGANASKADGVHWIEFAVIGAYFALYFFYGTIPLGIWSVFTLRSVDRPQCTTHAIDTAFDALNPPGQNARSASR